MARNLLAMRLILEGESGHSGRSGYKSEAKTKTYSITIRSDLHKQQMDFQETDPYKENIKQRYKIEAKNSELKNVHGYGRAIPMG